MKLTYFALAAGVIIAPAAFSAPAQLHVDKTQLKDNHGHVVRLQGVNVPGLEWSSTGDHSLQSVQVAADKWNANFIRLPLSQDRWFGKGPEQHDGGTAYQALIEQVVKTISSRNKHVLLDLHWSDGNEWGLHIGQHSMPDDKSLLFWKSISLKYANNPAVLFDLYNEPRDVSWDVWQNGGDVIEHNQDPSRGLSLSYHTPGLQSVVNTIRATGAKNVLVAGGLDWAFDLSGLLTGHALQDRTGNGIMYATHIYPWKKDWDQHITPALAKYAVYVGEVGCEPNKPNDAAWQKVDTATWAPQVISYINQNNLSWTAWSFHPSAGPTVISDWNYTPTPYWGSYVQTALAKAH